MPFVKKKPGTNVANRVFDAAHAAADRIAKQHPLYTPVCRLPELVKESDPIIPHTFDAGEGVLIRARSCTMRRMAAGHL